MGNPRQLQMEELTKEYGAETVRWEKCFITKPIVMKVPRMGRVRPSYKEQIIPRSPWATLSISRDKIAIKRAYARALARRSIYCRLLRLVNNRERNASRERERERLIEKERTRKFPEWRNV